jgi:hypothetical protein
VVLTEDCRLDAKQFPSLPDEKIDIERNLTITSAGSEKQLLELSFIKHAAVLRKGVTLTISNLALGRVRKTSGWSVPFFEGTALQQRQLLQLLHHCPGQSLHGTPAMLDPNNICRPQVAGRCLLSTDLTRFRDGHPAVLCACLCSDVCQRCCHFCVGTAPTAACAGDGMLLMQNVLRVRSFCPRKPRNSSLPTPNSVSRPAAFPGRQQVRGAAVAGTWHGT